jgi:hypothetical protein
MATGTPEGSHPCTAMGPASCCETSVPVPAPDAGTVVAPPPGLQVLLPFAGPVLHSAAAAPLGEPFRLASRSVVLRL